MKRSNSLKQSLDDVKYEQYVNNLHDRLPKLDDPDDIDCQRWPWELVQNAKDTVVKRPNPEDRYVDVIFQYFIDTNGEKKLSFEHNGDQFTNKAITGLIWKFSAEKRNEQTTEDGLTRDKQSTGRFGTGFMTTHALSLTVDVSGSLFHDDPGIMRNVSVDFTLHREGPDDAAYKSGVDLTERELDENMDKHHIPAGEILPTRFTYHLNKEGSEKAAKMGVENVRANGAQTMLFCPSIRSIKVIDDVNDLTFKITRQNGDDRKNVIKEAVFIEESNDRSEPIIRRFISTEIEEYSEPISSHWKANGRNLRLNVAVEVDEDKNILPIPPTSPAVYCSLPLIGFESMSLPFYINSNDFEPETERTSLYLKKKRYEYHTNEDTGAEGTYYLKSGINWSIFERSISLYEKIVDYLIENNYNQRYNLVNGLNDVLKSSWGTETKNCLASRFILPLRNMLIGKDLVKTANGYRSIKSEVKFVECAKGCDLHVLYKICENIYGTNLAVEEENEYWVSIKWGRFTFDNDFDEKKPDSENPAISTIRYDMIADFIENAESLDKLPLIMPVRNEASLDTAEKNDTHVKILKLEWLNKFYAWVVNSKITNLAEKKLVPNRLGVFCSTEQGCDLKDASEIPMVIFDFMKQIELDWDKNLLMEGVQHITLAKETKDNIITAVKNRSKEIRDNVYDNNNCKLTKLLPIILALPSNEDGRTEEFLRKRMQIVSILKTMYATMCEDKNSIILDLKAETWEDTDKWFMNLVASALAERKHLDFIADDDTEEDKKAKYCTSRWLSETLNFMFQKSYLHQEDITSKEDKKDTLALIPNRYGDFLPINQLYKQSHVPDELLDDELNRTGYDIKKDLIYIGFRLNEKITISEFTIAKLASIYNSFFESDLNDDDKHAVAKYIIHLIPECGDQYNEIRELYNIFTKANVEESKTTTIPISDLTVWTGAKNYLVKNLCTEASKLSNLDSIGKKISIVNDGNSTPQDSNFIDIGLSWLNRLSAILDKSKIDIGDDVKLVPDLFGILHCKTEMKYNGKVLMSYHQVSKLIDIINGPMWQYFYDMTIEGQNESLLLEEDNGMLSRIVHSNYYNVEDYQNNTDEKVFDLVDRIIYYCSRHYSTDWIGILKGSIKSLLSFFDVNEQKDPVFFYYRNDERLERWFKKTYPKRKELSYDFVYDAETKARFSQINDNYSSDEIEILIENRDFVKKILQNRDLSTIQKIIEEFPDTNFESILNILRREQGDFNTERIQQNISNERKREIGDKGECFVYEMLCRRFGSSNITWSNYSPTDENARILSFNGRDYRLITTSHDFDFIVSHNTKTIYIEVKTTVGTIKSSKDFPLIFETKEWEWIDNVQNEESLHYIVRVFDIEGSPKAYFLKQSLFVE